LARQKAQGTSFDRLLVNGQPAAIVGPVREETADLLTSYYGDRWKWWVLIAGIKGGTWLVRNMYRPCDCHLLLEPGDEPRAVKSSWNSTPPARIPIRTKRGRTAKV